MRVGSFPFARDRSTATRGRYVVEGVSWLWVVAGATIFMAQFRDLLVHVLNRVVGN